MGDGGAWWVKVRWERPSDAVRGNTLRFKLMVPRPTLSLVRFKGVIFGPGIQPHMQPAHTEAAGAQKDRCITNVGNSLQHGLAHCTAKRTNIFLRYGAEKGGQMGMITS